MRGPKPQPNALKKLAGDGIHDSGGRTIDPEPQATPGAPDRPDDLSDGAVIAWDDFVKDMDGMGVITHADRAALAILAEAWAEMVEAHQQVVKNGRVIKYPNGQPGPNPFCKTRNDARAIVLKMLPEFGLTPSSRSRMKATIEETEDDDFGAELR